MSGKILKQKGTRSRGWDQTSLLPAQEQSHGTMAVRRDTALLQSWSLLEQFSPQIFTFFPHVWEWILPWLKVCGSVAAHTASAEVSWTLDFVEVTLSWLATLLKPNFSVCRTQSKTGIFLRAFYFNFQHIYPLVFCHLITNRWFNMNINNPHQNRIAGVGRDLCGSSSPPPLPKQGHLQ